MDPISYKGHTIRERRMHRASPPEGHRQSWYEIQVVKGRRIVARLGTVPEAERWIDRRVGEEGPVDPDDPRTWLKTGHTASDGAPVLINPKSGARCVLPRSSWSAPNTPRTPALYEAEVKGQVEKAGPVMLQALTDIATLKGYSTWTGTPEAYIAALADIAKAAVATATER